MQNKDFEYKSEDFSFSDSSKGMNDNALNRLRSTINRSRSSYVDDNNGGEFDMTAPISPTNNYHFSKT